MGTRTTVSKKQKKEFQQLNADFYWGLIATKPEIKKKIEKLRKSVDPFDELRYLRYEVCKYFLYI